MTQYTTGNSGKVLNNEWHRERRLAITEHFNIREFGDIDIQKYDLDELEFTRKYKDSTYVTDTRLESEGSAKSGVDIRTIDDIRD